MHDVGDGVSRLWEGWPFRVKNLGYRRPVAAGVATLTVQWRSDPSLTGQGCRQVTRALSTRELGVDSVHVSPT